MQMLSVREIAQAWGVEESQVTRWCRGGRLPGAYKQGKQWMIPADSRMPEDGRKKTGSKIETRRPVRLAPPVGISDYRKAATEYYYVDKTLMIKDFLDARPMVSLFTRPRRFGKTLNMDMLRTFFERTDEDTSVYFKDKKIWACGKKYRAYQGKYPVIFMSFKDVKFSSWEMTYESLYKTIAHEFSRHDELAQSQSCDVLDKECYQKVINGEASVAELSDALAILSRMLHEHYAVAPIIIIDEYDTPIQQGHSCGFYDEVVGFMRNLFSGGLKDNKHLSYGFLTGILRIAKESIFSGLNNLSVNSIMDNKFSQYFGFTSDEVKAMAQYYSVPEKYDEICAWYDGYRFGNTEIFNPWSVINYFYRDCEPQAYWLSTGSNEIIGEILANADTDTYERLHALLQNQSFITCIDTSVIYPQLQDNPSSIFSFLLVAGYLKTVKSGLSSSGDFMCEVALPNKEISYVYNKEILAKLNHICSSKVAVSIQEALYSNDGAKLKKQLETLLLESASSFDTVDENFYHGLMLGLCVLFADRYYVTSNRESGEGRYDIQLMPKSLGYPGILIELKADKKCTPEALKELAKTALQQIKDCKYDTDMTAKGVRNIFKFGVAFSGKKVEIEIE